MNTKSESIRLALSLVLFLTLSPLVSIGQRHESGKAINQKELGQIAEAWFQEITKTMQEKGGIHAL